MSLASEYRRQLAWRPWPEIFEGLPFVGGRTVLDLGCAVGDQAAELVTRGAHVVGVDANEELLREARGRELPNAEFRNGDVRAPPVLDEPADGIWCSFTAGYLTDLAAVLRCWRRHLRAGGWVALTEVDDLFGHEPLAARTRALLAGYAAEALAAARFDFHMGRKLRAHLEQAGFTVTAELQLGDLELAFDGPARPEVVDAWRHRLARMQLLREFCGAEFARVADDLLACLARADHRCTASVRCCLGRG